MRLVTYSAGAQPARSGVRVGHRVLDIEGASRVQGKPLPSSISESVLAHKKPAEPGGKLQAAQ